MSKRQNVDISWHFHAYATIIVFQLSVVASLLRKIIEAVEALS